MAMKRGLLTTVCGLVAVWTVAGTHEPAAKLGATRETQGKQLSGFCLTGDGNIVTADEQGKCLRVIAPDDTLKALWKLDFAPQAVAWSASDKTVLVAGDGKVAVFDAQGKVLHQGALPQAGAKGGPRTVSSISSSGADVFVTARVNTGFSVFRLDRALGQSKTILTGLRGCCGQMDVMASGDTVYVAANCEFEVGLYDRDGKKKGAIKKPKGATYFDGCCEPKNLFMGADGALYVAESAKCAINRFSTDGKHLGEVGIIKDIGGCVRVTVAASPDGATVYMLDTDRNVVRVLKKKG